MHLRCYFLALFICMVQASLEKVPEWDSTKDLEIAYKNLSPSLGSVFKSIIHNFDHELLHLAAANGRLDMVEYQVDVLGKDINKFCSVVHRITPLWLAACARQFRICKYLLEKGAIIDSPRGGASTFFFACLSEDMKLVKLFLNHARSSKEISSQSIACNKIKLTVLRNHALFFPYQFRVQDGDEKIGFAPVIHCAVRNGDCSLLQDCLDGTYGPDNQSITSEDADGNQPLVYAATNALPLVVEILIQKGAPIYHRNKEGKHAMHYVSRILKKVELDDLQRVRFEKIQKILLEPAFLLYKIFGKVLPNEIRFEIQKHF